MPIDREKVLQAAQKHVEKKRFDRAIVEYQKIVQEDPNDARTLLKIGDLQARMQAFEAAIATYERVARHYGSQGFSVKAIAVYKQIREIIRKHVPQLAEQYGHIIPKLAQLYQDLGLTGDALSAYDEYAAHLQRTGRDREAIDIFHKIVEINGNNPLTRLRLAEALLRQQETQEALNQFSVASEILLGMGRTDDALKVIERMLYQKPDPGLARRAAEIYLERGKDEDGMMALAKLQICFQADHRDLKTLLLLSRAFEAIGQAPKATEVRKELARIARDQGQFEIAKEAARALLAEAPDNEEAQTLARSILAAERASAAPGARSQPPPGIPALRPPALPDDAVIEVSEEFVDIGEDSVELSDASVEVESGELMADDDYEQVPRLELVAQQQDDFGLGSDDYEELEPMTETDAGELRELDSPRSIRAVEVVDGLEVAEDFGTAQHIDPRAHAREVLSNAHAYRAHHLYDKAIETLRIGLELNPNDFDLHVALKDALIEAGDADGAYDEILVIADFYIESQDLQSAAQMLSEALALVSSDARAREMLVQLGYDVTAPLHDTAEVRAATGFETRGPMSTVQALPGYEDDFVGGHDHSEPLPSYDLEEINPSYAMSSVPHERADYAALLTADDPFAAVDAAKLPRADLIDEPFADAAAPLPSFPLSDEGQVPNEIAELDAGYDDVAGPPSYAGHRPSHPGYESVRESYGSHPYGASYREPYPSDAAYYPETDTDAALGYDRELVDDHPTYDVEPRTDLGAPSPLAGTRAFQGGDSLEDALEEAEFFASRGLFEDALAILEEQGQRFPNHPLLLERMREVRDAMEAGGSGEHVLPPVEPPYETTEDNAFDIAASLDVLDGGAMAPDVEHHDGFGKAVDVEEVFAKFKEGVKQQVSESDSQTHYDLGVAYKEMGLLSDAITEFTMAARDPKRECVCWSMIGIVQNEVGNADGAIEAFIRGLHAEHKSMEQELALYFELGCVYQYRDNPQEALYYFEKVMRRDPAFRDVSERVRSLQAKTDPPRYRTAVGDDDFDRAFDDLFSDSKLSQG